MIYWRLYHPVIIALSPDDADDGEELLLAEELLLSENGLLDEECEELLLMELLLELMLELLLE